MSNTLDKFTEAYIECALWSSTYDDESGTHSFDDAYDASDIEPKSLQSMIAECADFQSSQADLLAQAYTLYSHSPEWSHEAQAGHDFWLTRNGHGAGFWDRGIGEVGDALTQAAKVYGSSDLYVGDDGKVYIA